MVTQRNFLDIYRYQSWGGQGELPLFEHGQRFQPAQILLKEVSEGTGGRGHAQLACRLRRWSTSGSAAPMAACWPQKQPVRCFCLSRAHHHAAANPINCLNTNPSLQGHPQPPSRLTERDLIQNGRVWHRHRRHGGRPHPEAGRGATPGDGGAHVGVPSVVMPHLLQRCPPKRPVMPPPPCPAPAPPPPTHPPVPPCLLATPD